MSSVPQPTPEQAVTHQRSTRIRPLDAIRSIRLALRNPDDTAQAVRALDATAGKSMDRQLKRFMDTPTGREILAREQSLLDVLIDRERLMAMPEGSLGRTYVDWLIREEISAEGLVAASEAVSQGGRESDGPYFVLGCRMREMHDLLHVAAGYGRDLAGEVGVLAFTYAQTGHTGIGFLVAMAYMRSFFRRRDQPAADRREARVSIRKQCRDGYRRGRRADWIVGADWEALLECPIDEVRQRFHISAPPDYFEVRSKGAPVLAA